MLTKNCKLILSYLVALPPDQRFTRHRTADLATKTGLSLAESLSACKELEKDGMVSFNILNLKTGRKIQESIELTELGLNYKAMLRAQRLAYLADKWTDILASVVAVCALIVSIAALLRTL